jgi:hypothetical protein
MGMLETNAGCAICIIGCASSEDATTCMLGCVDAAYSCTAVDQAHIDGVFAVRALGVGDRDGINDILENVTASCAYCVLATVAHTCGDRCVQEHFHINLDYDIRPRDCVPAVSGALQAVEAQKLSAALGMGQPFGLATTWVTASSHANPTDLYVPTSASASGMSVYRGTRTGWYARACDSAAHLGVWVLAASADLNGPSGCDMGDLWLDLGTGGARSVKDPSAAADAHVRTAVFTDAWRGCARFLPFEPNQYQPSGNTVELRPDASAEHVACWLAHFLGPHAGAGSEVGTITLPRGIGPVVLVADIVIQPGSAVHIVGNGATLWVGKHQLRVESGASVALDDLSITASVSSSAMVLATSAKAAATGVALNNCTASRTTFVESIGEGAYVDVALSDLSQPCACGSKDVPALVA